MTFNRHAWVKANPEKIASYQRKYAQTHPEMMRAKQARWKQRHPEETRAWVRGAYARAKYELLVAYGGPICVCCGEETLDFLTLDHVNGDGAIHRRQFGGATALYIWLRQNGYPDDVPLQVLCWNCQWGKRKNSDVCPHEGQGQQDHRRGDR